MLHTDSIDIDCTSPPFDQFKSIQRLQRNRSGRSSTEHARHHLYVGRHKQSSTRVFIKLASKLGLVYQQDLANEIASLSTINRELPASRYFPVVQGHGSLPDGRVYLITSLFDELPLATGIATERLPAKEVAHLRTVMEVSKALAELHRLQIFHVDLNPMNILYRAENGRPVVRIVDFESSYERARHTMGVPYNPPTTPEYAAPEVSHRAPDSRSDLFSLGVVLYTMLAGDQWAWDGEIGTCIDADHQLDPELKSILLAAVDLDPDRRYPTIQQFHSVLAGHLERIWPGRSW